MIVITAIAVTAVPADRISHSHQFWKSKDNLFDAEMGVSRDSLSNGVWESTSRSSRLASGLESSRWRPTVDMVVDLNEGK